MIAAVMVMEIEQPAFLLTISSQQCRVQIKDHFPRHGDRIDCFSHLLQDREELSQGRIVHTVPETGKRWLGCKRVFVYKPCKERIFSEMVGTVIRKISCKDLIQELEQHGTVGMFTEQIFPGSSKCLRNDVLKPHDPHKIIEHEQTGIRRKVSSVKVHFKTAIAFKRDGV